MTSWVDVVEKVARSVGVVLLGRFDPAELSRLLGFVAAGLAATSTRTRSDVIISDLRQMLCAAGRVVDLHAPQ